MKKMWTKLDEYNALLRNGFYLPDFESKAINLNYLRGLIEDRYLSLKFKNVKFIKVVDPPAKLKLLKYIKKEIENLKDW